MGWMKMIGNTRKQLKLLGGETMKIVAIKDMAAGNAEVGEMWQETKIFDHEDKLIDVMKWADGRNKRVTITIPDNYEQEVINMALKLD
jgi:hypothetical protein